MARCDGRGVFWIKRSIGVAQGGRDEPHLVPCGDSEDESSGAQNWHVCTNKEAKGHMKDQPESTLAIPDVTLVYQAVQEHFPGLWPAVELGLSVGATLLLADNANPVAVTMLGMPPRARQRSQICLRTTR
jgi:hypothetical protein